MATYQELLAQREALNMQIEAARKTELADAISRVRAIIKEYGLTAAQCGFSSEEVNASGKVGKIVQPKYVTPDGLHYWSGRGNPPVPFKTLFAAGHQKEDFLIKKNNA